MLDTLGEISRILNQNCVNSEFVKGRPKSSRSSFCLFYVYSCLNFQMNTFTRQSAIWLLFNTIDYKYTNIFQVAAKE